MRELDDNRKQTVAGFGCGIAFTGVGGVGLMGSFIADGLAWPWVVVMTLVLLCAIGGLANAIESTLNSAGDSGGDGRDGGSAPDPNPAPQPSVQIPDAWPPAPLASTPSPGSLCPLCQRPAAEGDTVDCLACEVPHHSECWYDLGGCGVFACGSQPR